MPEFVLERAYNIMKEQGIKDVKRVGLYGLTYKENVDDTRDSPTLQLLDCMARHLAGGLKVYDPYINEKIVDNQILDFNEFLDSVDMVIIMVGHNHLKENMARIEEKVIFDTRNACPFEHAYKL
jgi:UDP-N-acetyl-D-mannosaminuronic acid dehydrogenase